MTEEEKLLAGKIFCPVKPELVAIKRISHMGCHKFNMTYEDDPQRPEIIKTILKDIGSNPYFQGPIWFNYGCHTTIGKDFFANYNFVVLDDALVTIGDKVLCGPNVTIATPMHPKVPSERKFMIDEDGNEFKPCYANPTVIGNNVWLAAGVIVCAGVTIGDDVVIGAGSVVTKDIPSGVLAAGNPCKVIREVNDGDSIKHLL